MNSALRAARGRVVGKMALTTRELSGRSDLDSGDTVQKCIGRLPHGVVILGCRSTEPWPCEVPGQVISVDFFH